MALDAPLYIRVSGVDLTPEIKEHTNALLGRRLARYGRFIDHVEVRFKDINGSHRGGIDTRCRIKLRLSKQPAVFVEERAADAEHAVALATATATRAIDNTLSRTGRADQSPAKAPGRRKRKPRAPRVTSSTKRSAQRRGRRKPKGGMVYTQEASATRPSRKSTRKSRNRQRSGNQLRRRAQRRKHTPRARAARAQKQRGRARGR